MENSGCLLRALHSDTTVARHTGGPRCSADVSPRPSGGSLGYRQLDRPPTAKVLWFRLELQSLAHSCIWCFRRLVKLAIIDSLERQQQFEDA